MAVDEGGQRSRFGPIVLIVVGSIVGLVALALVAAGVAVVWADLGPARRRLRVP